QTQAAQDQTQTDQAQTETAQPITAKDLTAADKSALRKSAHFAKKLYEPLNPQVFNLAPSRAAQAHNPELPNDATLTTDRQDYPPYSYVYFHGSGFQPGETVDMLVVETDPVQQSFQPWYVVADANGEFDTSWFIYSSDFNGATFLATATGETSQLTASATFTDGSGDGDMQVSPSTAVPGSSGNSFTFNFRTPNALFTQNSYVDVVVPAAWTAPTFPGNVSAAVADGAVTTVSTSIPVAGTIRVTFTGATGAPIGDGNGSHFTYSPGGTAPAAGFYKFNTGSHNGGGS